MTDPTPESGDRLRSKMMSDEELRRASNAMVEFESALSDVLLRAFACGAKLEGEWRITLPVAEAPDWTVSITRVEPEVEGGYEPSLIDE